MAKQLLRIFVLFICCCILTACNQNSIIRDNVSYEKSIETKSEFYFIDTNQINLGYINFYLPANWFVIMNKLDSEFEQTIYTAIDETKSYKIPLSYGNGTYEFKIFDSSMQLIHTETISIDDLTDNILFTMSNDVINFSTSDLIKNIASNSYIKTSSNNDYLILINQYVNKHIKYDIDSRDLDMFVTPENILVRGSGVCYEKAKLLTALIRIKNIPCKLVFGNYNNEYHAWCEVLINDKWLIADPTSNSITSINDEQYTNRVKIY